MPAALSARGFTVLRDARTRLTVRGETLDLAGIRYWTRKAIDIGRVLRGAAPMTILLAHTPMRLHEAAAFAVPLMLSGHTHGGQIVLPGLGAIAAREFPIIAGVGREDNTTAFVSRGVGTVYVPVRLNCPPEAALLTLQPIRSALEAARGVMFSHTCTRAARHRWAWGDRAGAVGWLARRLDLGLRRRDCGLHRLCRRLGHAGSRARALSSAVARRRRRGADRDPAARIRPSRRGCARRGAMAPHARPFRRPCVAPPWRS